jgi:hypothetical protein
VADVQILVAGTESLPFSYEVPNAQEIQPKAVSAIFDGSAAAAAFLPMLEVVSDGGVVVAQSPASSVAAGGSAEVSWFPGSLGSVSAGSVAVVGARIQATATQSIPDSSNTDLVYDTVLFDTDGMANLGSDNRILTVNTAGLYIVICETTWAPNDAGRRINVAVHNAFYSGGSVPSQDSQASEGPAVWNPQGGGLGRTQSSCTGLYLAAAGDFFSSGAFQGSGTSINANGFNNCFLSALLVGTT